LVRYTVFSTFLYDSVETYQGLIALKVVTKFHIFVWWVLILKLCNSFIYNKESGTSSKTKNIKDVIRKFDTQAAWLLAAWTSKSFLI